MRVRCERKDTSVWRLYLEAGERGDVSLDGGGLQELESAIDEAESSDACRVVVIQSGAGMFCQGMDLNFLLAHAGEDHSERIASYARCMRRLRATKRPVICIVDGEATGGGVGLAAASDHLIATQKASFALPEVVLGLIPAMVMPLLQERMPAQKARWFALSGRRVRAREAAELGLVDQLVDGPIEAEAALRALLKRLLRASPRALARVKAFSESIAGEACDVGLDTGANQTSLDLLDLETISAIRAFLNGESPPWFERYKSGGRP